MGCEKGKGRKGGREEGKDGITGGLLIVFNMKSFILVGVFCFIASLCFSQSQGDMNKEADQNFRKTDKELNLVYQNVLKEYATDKVFIKNLKNAQRLWVQLRDAEMLAKYPETNSHAYGSAHPMCWSMYLTELTKERITRLKVWTNGFDEGDVCNGSVRTN